MPLAQFYYLARCDFIKLKMSNAGHSEHSAFRRIASPDKSLATYNQFANCGVRFKFACKAYIYILLRAISRGFGEIYLYGAIVR